MTTRRYYTLPAIPDAGLLTRYMDTLGVIVPVARTNLVINPSVETNATGYTSTGGLTSVDRAIGISYHGAYGLVASLANPDATAGFYYGPISLTSGQLYAVSCKFKSPSIGLQYKLSVATTGGVDLAAFNFIAAGVWQWVWVYWLETSTTTRRIYLRKNDAKNDAQSVFYADGFQCEAINAGETVSTFIDGDQKGLVPNQYPPAYGWNGTPHASTSYRTGQTRAGGQVLYWKSLGFYLTTIIGLGLATPAHQALTFAQLDGGQYLNTLKPPRQFTMAGRWGGGTPNELDASISQLGRVLDRDLVGGQRQPLVLTMQAQECGVPCGQPITVQALYDGGMEGEVKEVPTATQPITFENYLPMIVGPDQGVALDVQDSLTSIGGILYRPPNGTWAKMGTGTNGSVNAIVVAPSGLVYVGGNFTDAGGSGADYLASWDPQTSTWAVVKSATSIGNTVNALALAPNGNLYIGGAFTNADGIAAADYIVMYNPNTNTFSALGTGMNDVVNALAVGPTGILYATGNFTTAGGVAAARVAQWNGSAWSALGTGFASPGQALAIGPSGILYAGGDFVNGGGVAAADYIASWNGTAWAGLSTGMNNSVNAIAVGLNGLVYAGGIFTTAGGVTAGGVAVYNGVGWQQLGSGFSSPGTDTPNAMAVRADGTLLIASSGAVIDPGTPGSLFQWNGSAFTDLGIASLSSGDAVTIAPDGTIYAGVSGTAVASGIVTASNSGTAVAYPQLIINGPTSGTSRIYQLRNITTNTAIYFNLTLSAGETAILTLDPKNVTFISSFQGNILSTILPGSRTTAFLLQPGDNTTAFLAASSTVTAYLSWSIGYTSLNDTIQQAVP